MKARPYVVKSIWFFLAAFSLSGVLLGVQVMAHVPGYGQLPMYGPTLAALIFLWCEKESIGRFLKTRLTFKVSLPVLLVLGIPIAVNGCVSYWTENYWGLANVLDLSSNTAESLWYMALMFPAVIGEEIGWRGYLLPKLQERFTPFVSSWLVGVIWGLWHTPTKLVSMSFFVFWFIQLLGFNFVFTFAYNKARPSIWSAILLHYILNISGYLLIQKTVESIRIMGIAYLLVGLVVVLLGWKGFSARPPQSDEPDPERPSGAHESGG
jgi:uncharacterized protein